MTFETQYRTLEGLVDGAAKIEERKERVAKGVDIVKVIDSLLYDPKKSRLESAPFRADRTEGEIDRLAELKLRIGREIFAVKGKGPASSLFGIDPTFPSSRSFEVTDAYLDSIKQAAQDAQNAALGDSNDREIELLRDALELALGALDMELPEGIDPDDEDDDEDDDEGTLCKECGEEPAYEGDYGMCSSCLHDAYRSGWVPGTNDSTTDPNHA